MYIVYQNQLFKKLNTLITSNNNITYRLDLQIH